MKRKKVPTSLLVLYRLLFTKQLIFDYFVIYTINKNKEDIYLELCLLLQDPI